MTFPANLATLLIVACVAQAADAPPICNRVLIVSVRAVAAKPDVLVVICDQWNPHYYHTTTPVSAVRARDWKLLEFFEDNHLELYNLRDDLSEKHDLAKEMPNRVAALRDQLQAWRESVGAALPKPNP